jgi:ATP-dependent RNA helicase DDX35
MGDVTGGVAGVSVRFLSLISENTKVKFMTEGILLREMLANPLLSEYSVIMIDEVS